MFIKCSKCSEVKVEAEFHRNKEKLNGRQSMCKVCAAARQKEQRAIPEVKEMNAAQKKEWNQTDVGRASQKKTHDKIRATPEGQQKDRVRMAVNHAVAAGRLIRPNVCDMSMSSENCEETKVEAHHFLGYDWFNRFDLQWLCRKHHEMADNFQERARAVA